MNQQLSDYIKQARAAGSTDEQIKKNLIDSGWGEEEVEEVMGAPQAPIAPEKKPDVFTTEQNAPEQESFNSGRRIKTIIISIAFVFGFVIAVGAAYIGYVKIFQSKKLNEVVSLVKQQKINEIVKNMEFLTNFNLNGRVVFQRSLLKEWQNIKLLEKADMIEINPLINVITSGKVDFSGDGIKVDAKNFVSYNIGESLGAFTKFRIIKDDKNDVFVNFENIPLLETLKSSDTEEPTIVGTWYRTISQKEIQDGDLKIPGLDPKKFMSDFTMLLEDGTIEFKEDNEMPKEKINGVNAYHYDILFDKENLLKYFSEIGLDAVNAETYDLFDMSGEIWIGTKDFLPRKIFLRLKLVNLNKIFPDQVQSGYVNLDMEFEFYNFNEVDVAQIKAPEKFVDLTEVARVSAGASIGDVFSDMLFGSARKRARDARRVADLRSLQIAFEMSYDEKESYPKSPDPAICIDITEETAGESVISYLYSIPQDPLSDQEYKYQFASDGNDFILSAKLENADNKPKGADSSGNTDCSCEGEYYCISN